MNATDTRMWLQFHSRLLSSFGGWMKSLTDDEAETFTEEAASLLRKVPYEEACRISRRMFAGEIEPPDCFSMTPATIKEHARIPAEPAQKTIGEIEEQNREREKVEPVKAAFLELLKSIGKYEEKKLPQGAIPKQYCGTLTCGKCKYCGGIVLYMADEGTCSDCLTIQTQAGKMLPHNEAKAAKAAGERARAKRKKKSSRIIAK